MKTKQDDKTDEVVTSRQRVQIALQHKEPDRIPVDFLATPEVWDKLVTHFQSNGARLDSGEFFSPEREVVLQQLEIDCRLISYDMFCAPPVIFGVITHGAWRILLVTMKNTFPGHCEQRFPWKI
jgi:hypothetical protein